MKSRRTVVIFNSPDVTRILSLDLTLVNCEKRSGYTKLRMEEESDIEDLEYIPMKKASRSKSLPFVLRHQPFKPMFLPNGDKPTLKVKKCMENLKCLETKYSFYTKYIEPKKAL